MKDKVHGELYIDEKGEVHFQCHTPAGVSFKELEEILIKFKALIEHQIASKERCPFYVR